MNFLYNLIVYIAGGSIKFFALFSPKINQFVKGRSHIDRALSKSIGKDDRTIWFHCASLGEFEQGLPVIEKIKTIYPDHKIVLTFFSPSGYEVKKNSAVADVIIYLPLDTVKNARKFLDLVHPELIVFVKYEFWPNYLSEIKKRGIKTLSISTIFREDQVFFRWYGGWMRKSLSAFTHFFVQNENSKRLLSSIGFNNVTVSGDTRFDRVSEILKRDNSLAFIEEFKQDNICLVAGSTWPEDEALLVNYINHEAKKGIKFIIAPHTMKPKDLKRLKDSLTKKTLLFSEREGAKLQDHDVFIIDTIGLLTKIYSYADIAYVGGGMGTNGLHNTLEPATFGMPIIIGKNYGKFKEVTDLIALGGIISIKDQTSFNACLNQLLSDSARHKGISAINRGYVQKNKGAVIQILDFIRTLL